MKFTAANSMLMASLLLVGVIASPVAQQPGKGPTPNPTPNPTLSPNPNPGQPDPGPNPSSPAPAPGPTSPGNPQQPGQPSTSTGSSTRTSVSTTTTATTTSSSTSAPPDETTVPRDVCAGNTASTRSEWCDYSIDTDYTVTSPDTGVTKEYWLELTDVTIAPDGVCESPSMIPHLATPINIYLSSQCHGCERDLSWPYSYRRLG